MKVRLNAWNKCKQKIRYGHGDGEEGRCGDEAERYRQPPCTTNAAFLVFSARFFWPQITRITQMGRIKSKPLRPICVIRVICGLIPWLRLCRAPGKEGIIRSADVAISWGFPQ